MFLNKNFVLANELVKHMGIHIANISMLRQAFEDNNDFYNIQKLNSCTVINSKARGLPNNIKSGLSTGTFTDLSDKLPCTYVRNEYGVTERELMSSGIVTGIVSVSGKDFYVFSPEFVKNLKNRMCYVLDEQETQECAAKGQIIGSIELSKNKFIVWY